MTFADLVAKQLEESDKDPSHAKAPNLGQLSNQFSQRLRMPMKAPKLGSLGKPGRGKVMPASNLRPKLHQGPHAIHGPGDMQPRFRFHSEVLAQGVAKLLSLRSKTPYEVRHSPVVQRHPFAPVQ